MQPYKMESSISPILAVNSLVRSIKGRRNSFSKITLFVQSEFIITKSEVSAVEDRMFCLIKLLSLITSITETLMNVRSAQDCNQMTIHERIKILYY